MNMYFKPDISKLYEVSKAKTEELMQVESEPAEARAPDISSVEQLLHMIEFARQATRQAA